MTLQTGPFPQATAPSQSWGAGPGAAPVGVPQLPPLNLQTGLPTGAQYRDLAYHRLALSDPKHRRWSPLAEGGALLVGVVVASIAFFIVGALIAVAVGGQNFLTDLSTGDMAQMDMTNPWLLLFLFGSVAIWLPIALLTRWLLRPRPVGLIWSVTGRIRWKWLLVTMGLATAVFVVIYGAATLLQMALTSGDPAADVVLAERHPLWWLTLVFAFLVVPIQCTAEEVVFRGYLAQSIGRWLKNPAWAILLPAPLFMLGHMYDVWGQLSVLWMAVITGFLTWRTGGLEAAISLHVVNNMVATLLAVAWPVQPATAEDASVGVFGFGVIFVIETVYALIVLLLIKRGRIAVTRRAVVWPKKDQDAWYHQVRAAYAAQAAQFGPFGVAPQTHGAVGQGYPQMPGGHQFTASPRFATGQPSNTGQPSSAAHQLPGNSAPESANLVPVVIPASMAYAQPHQINPDGSLRLVPADGLIAYAAPETELIPGSDPPVHAHPVVWMARAEPASGGQQATSGTQQGEQL